jgi:cell division protein FtsL
MLLVACLGAIVLVALEFPIHQLMGQRRQITAAASALAAVESHNATLRSDIASLSKSSTIASIAHEEYGLVRPGQRSYVILPSRGAMRSVDPASSLSIPVEALGSTSGAPAAASVTPAPARVASGSLWARMLTHLEFWR